MEKKDDLVRQRAEKLLSEGKMAAASNEYARAVEFLQVSARMYNRLNEIDKVIEIAYEMAEIYSTWGRFDEAVKTLNLVIKMQRANKDISEATSLHRLAQVYHIFGKDDRALKALRRAARLFRAQDATEDVVFTLLKIAHVLCSGGRYSESIETYKQTLELIEENSLTHLKHQCLEGMANTYKAWGRGNQAVEYFRQSLAAKSVNS
ncbi:MAG: tetratricopeptide repeat protein [Candidatus Hodarchaeota archaeon]